MDMCVCPSILKSASYLTGKHWNHLTNVWNEARMLIIFMYYYIIRGISQHNQIREKQLKTWKLDTIVFPFYL